MDLRKGLDVHVCSSRAWKHPKEIDDLTEDELWDMNEKSLHSETTLKEGTSERYLLKVKPGSSPGIAIKSGLWPEIGQCSDQSEVPAPALI